MWRVGEVGLAAGDPRSRARSDQVGDRFSELGILFFSSFVLATTTRSA